MPQIVPAHQRQPCFFQCCPEISIHCVAAVPVVSRFIREHQLQSIFRTGKPPSFQFRYHCWSQINSPVWCLVFCWIETPLIEWPLYTNLAVPPIHTRPFKSQQFPLPRSTHYSQLNQRFVFLILNGFKQGFYLSGCEYLDYLFFSVPLASWALSITQWIVVNISMSHRIGYNLTKSYQNLEQGKIFMPSICRLAIKFSIFAVVIRLTFNESSSPK